MDVFTSITLNYLPKAQILARSLKKYHADWRFHLLVCDRLPEGGGAPASVFDRTLFDRVVWLDELAAPDLQSWIFKHTVVELCTAVKGIFLQQLVREGVDKIVYIDPDIVVFNPISEVETLLDQHAILMTPHLLQYTDNPQSIHDNEIAGTLRHGTFNLGFLAVTASRLEGRKFSEWWGRRLYEYCYADFEHGLFTDQKWCDLVPSFFEDYFIIRDPGFNVASWNLDCRQLSFSEEGQLHVNSGQPLRFYHFTGYDSGAGINVINELTSTGKNLIARELWSWYMRELPVNGNEKWGKQKCHYDSFDNGATITNEMRTVYRTDPALQAMFKNPFETNAGKGGYYAWWMHKFPATRPAPREEGNARSEPARLGPAPARPGKLPLVQAQTYQQSLRSERSGDSKDYVPLSKDTLASADVAVKAVAFYLPQFHPIPENDAWWGKGFTEWSNVARAVPQFPGHYQPRLPGELGFYDLRIREIQYRQIELAQQYGLHGFAFYYYWFGGKRLLEFPIDQFLVDKDKKFPFCLVWANENWTRRWDGLEKDVLIAQTHGPETDVQFIQSLEPYLKDDRYIRINDRPMIIIYQASVLPDPVNTVNRWRQYCAEHKLGDPYLIAAQTFGFEDPRPLGFDAAVQFPPHNQLHHPRFRINDAIQIANPDFHSYIFSYPEVVKYKEAEPEDAAYSLYKTVFPSWDSEPRKPGRGTIFAHSSPQLYARWLRAAGQWTLKNHPSEERFVFINAWNEWAEGAYLEPDRRYGYAYLQATMDVLRSLGK